jgi:hypothetical protein
MAEQTKPEFDVTVSHRLPESLVPSVDQWAQRTWCDRAKILSAIRCRGQLLKKVRSAFLPFQAQERWAERPTPQALPTITPALNPAFILSSYPPATATFRPSLLRLAKTARPLRVERALSSPVIGSLSCRVIERLSGCVIENRRDPLHSLNPRPLPGPKGRGGHCIARSPDHSMAQLPSPLKRVLHEAVNCRRQRGTRGDDRDAPALA